jgi:hypothetical protein
VQVATLPTPDALKCAGEGISSLTGPTTLTIYPHEQIRMTGTVSRAVLAGVSHGQRGARRNCTCASAVTYNQAVRPVSSPDASWRVSWQS